MTRAAPRRPATPRKPESGADAARRKLIFAVRAACRRLGIGDDDRKALQQNMIGVASMSDMSLADLGRLLDHLNKGWNGPAGHNPHIGKAKALWWSLYWLAEIHQPDDKALSSFVQRQTGISSLRFLDHRHAASVIEALKAWLARVGVAWPTEAEVTEITGFTPGYSSGLADRHAVLTAIGEKLERHGLIRTWVYDYVSTALGLKANRHMWSAQELDACIRLVGRRLRKVREAAQ